MKKIAIAGVIAMLLSAGSYAADMSLLLGGGWNFSKDIGTQDYKNTLAGDTFTSSQIKYLSGYNASLSYWLQGNDKWGVLTGVSLESHGSHYQGVGDNEHDYLEIPLQVSYCFFPNFNVFVGPQLGIAVTEPSISKVALPDTVSISHDLINPSLQDTVKVSRAYTGYNYHAIDLGISANVTYTLFDKILIGAGYCYDFTDALINPVGVSGVLNHTTFKVFLAYKYTVAFSK